MAWPPRLGFFFFLVTNVQVYHDIYRGDEDFGCNKYNHLEIC